MILRWLIYFFYLCTPLLAGQWDLEATFLKYTGQHLLLEGNVKIQNELGTMSAQKADAWSEGHSFDNFVELFLEGNVEFSSIGFGILTSSTFALFPKELRGACPKTKQKIKYIKDNWELSCDSIFFSLSENSNNKTNLYSLDAIGNICVNYAKEAFIYSDSLYLTSSPHYMLTFLPKQKDETCRFTRQNGDRIHAQKISLEHSTELLKLENAEGELWIDESLIQFESNIVHWHHQEKNLELQGSPLLFSDELRIQAQGTIIAKDVPFKKDEVSNWQEVFAQGPLTITFKDTEGSKHYLETDGYLEIFPKEGTLFIQSKTLPVNYIHPKGSAQANKATITYKNIQNPFEIETLALNGNVEIRYMNEKGNSIQQFVKADTMVASLKTHVVDLFCSNKQMVSVSDFSKGIEIKGSHIQGKKEANSNEFSFNGVGKVEITLLPKDDEYAR